MSPSLKLSEAWHELFLRFVLLITFCTSVLSCVGCSWRINSLKSLVSFRTKRGYLQYPQTDRLLWAFGYRRGAAAALTVLLPPPTGSRWRHRGDYITVIGVYIHHCDYELNGKYFSQVKNQPGMMDSRLSEIRDGRDKVNRGSSVMVFLTIKVRCIRGPYHTLSAA